MALEEEGELEGGSGAARPATTIRSRGRRRESEERRSDETVRKVEASVVGK